MIQIEKSKKTSNFDWYTAELDYLSLQICLGFQDEIFDPEGMDQICYDIYGKIDPVSGNILKAGHADVHSATSTGVFVLPVGLKVIEIEDESGKKNAFADVTPILIKRNGKEIEITGEEILETDEFIKCLESFNKR